MRKPMIAMAVIALSASLPSPVVADRGLEAKVAIRSGIERSHSDTLHAEAHDRVQAIVEDFRHQVEWPHAEVIGWNRWAPDPVRAIVDGWMDSPEHRAILRDPALVAIGCAELVADDPRKAGEDETHYFVCILTHATAEPDIPDTAMPLRGG